MLPAHIQPLLRLKYHYSTTDAVTCRLTHKHRTQSSLWLKLNE